MRRIRSPFTRPVGLLVAGLLFSAPIACGSDRGDRGLQPSNETDSPVSNTQDAMTEADRRRQEMTDIQQREAEAFDEAAHDE
jgi:hypothetical protein